MGISALFGKKKNPVCTAVILAAGMSQRMGTDKVNAQLGGLPVIVRTLKAFQASEYVEGIIVVTRMEEISHIADLCRQYEISKVKTVVAGGKTRTESALIGVSNVKGSGKLIAIHDGARPLVTGAVIKRTVCAADEYMAAVPVINSTDTLKVIDSLNRITGTVDRNTTFRVQTPQVFDADLIKGALTKAVNSNIELTDDSSALEMTGFSCYSVAGEEDNIKLTTPRDMIIAEAILKSRGDQT